MALYTLVSKEQALNPLINYNGNDTWVRNQMASMGYGPSAAETQMYNMLGRDAGSQTSNDNFFTKKASSIGNAVGTTLSAPISLAHDIGENVATQKFLGDSKSRMNDVAKKYGYNSYHDVWDAQDKAEAEGDQTTLDFIKNTINPELQAQANANAEEATAKAKGYEDYRKNNLISKNINQDRGKFLGSAINTLSTAVDIAGLGANPLTNAIQGGVEGIADELEQNGLQNFDWGRAGQNAAIGATTGAVTGALNQGVSNALAKRGGNLFKGGNALTRGLNDLGSSTALGRVGSTIATGAGRGALSGAVGGATGAGLSAAMNRRDILGSALQGAAQGAQQGAFTGATMAGANMAVNKTPGVGKLMKDVNQTQEDWRNSGDNFKDKLNNTLNSGKSVVGNELAIERLAKGIKRGTDGDIRFVDMTQDVFDDINNIRTQNGLEPITERQVIAFKNAVNNNLNNRVNEGLNARQVAKIAFNSLASEDARAIPGYYENQVAISRPGLKNDYDTSVIGLAEDGRTSLKSIEPRTQNQVELFELQGQQKNGPKSQLGFSLAEEQPTSGSIVPQNRQNVNVNFDDMDMDTLSAYRRDMYDRYKSETDPVIKEQYKQNLFAAQDAQSRRLNAVGAEEVRQQLGNRLGGGDVDDATRRRVAEAMAETSVKNPSDPVEWDNEVTRALQYLEGTNTKSQMGKILSNEGLTPEDINRVLGGNNEFDYVFEDARGNRSRLPELRSSLNPDGNTVIANSDLIDSPVRGRMYDRMSNDDFIDYAEQNGWKLVETPQRQATPETEIYRTLTGNGEEPFLAYGESDLANGKTQRQNLLSKAGRAMEAAQVNATRKETRDIGIENSGELVNRLRKRTGYTNIEDQAAFGRELTGGENSLLDTIQRNAVAATEDGSARTVEIDKIIPQVNKLIDEAPNTLVSPSKKAEVRDAVIADLTNTGLDTIQKANNFKAAAKQQFLINDRTPNDPAKALGKLYTRIAELVDDASYAEVPKTQVEAMFETASTEARARAQVATKNGNKEAATAYSNLADEIDASPKTIQAYRSLKKDYVDINKLSRKTQQGATAWNNPLTMGTALTAAMMTGNPLTAVPAAWAAKTFAPAIGEAAIGTSAKLGGKIADWGDSISARKAGTPTPSPSTTNSGATETTYNPSTQIFNAIGRNEGLSNGEQARTAQYLANATNATNPQVPMTGTLEGLITPTVNMDSTNVYDSVYGTTPTATTAAMGTGTGATASSAGQYFQPTGDYWTDLLGRALSSAIEADDVEAFGALFGMYQDAISKLQSNATKGSSEKLTATQQRANAAMNSLDRLAQMNPDLGYNLSNIPLIGDIATFGGNDYESEAKSLAQQIGYMVSGANIKEEEAYNIGRAYVPQPFDSESTRRNKLQRAREIIAQYQNGYATE